MNRFWPARWHLMVACALLIAGLSLALAVSPVAAQGGTPTPADEVVSDQGGVAEPGAVVVPVADTGPLATLGLQDYFWRLILPLAFGLGALWLLRDYYDRAQTKYYDLVGRLSHAGRSVQTTVVSEMGIQSLGTRGGEAATQLQVTGPSKITAGSPATFSAMDMNGDPMVVVWSMDPADAATLSATRGPATTVTAQGQRDLVLTATPDAGGEPVEFPISVAAEGDGDVELAFVGQGAGSILLAVLIISVVMSLAALNILSGEATAALLGTLAGYIFGVGRRDDT